MIRCGGLALFLCVVLAGLAVAAPRVHTAYFLRGEDIPSSLDHAFDVVVVPWRSLIDASGTKIDSCKALQAAGHDICVHVPISYLEHTGGTSMHDSLRTITGDTTNGAGWLRDKDGYLHGTAAWKYIDPRPKAIRDSLIAAHVAFFDDADYVPEGLFLDFIWDEIEWACDQGGDQDSTDAFNLAYRTAMYALAAGIKDGLTGKVMYGNGWHRCTTLDAICYESFPQTKMDTVWGGADHRGSDVALWGYYGKDTWTLFDKPPMLLTTDSTPEAGYNIPAERIVETVSFAYSYCPRAVVVDNEGNVFQAIADLEGLSITGYAGRRR